MLIGNGENEFPPCLQGKKKRFVFASGEFTRTVKHRTFFYQACLTRRSLFSCHSASPSAYDKFTSAFHARKNRVPKGTRSCVKSGDYLSSRRLTASTFGVKELNFCVRNGNRWILFAIITAMVIYSAFAVYILNNKSS